MLTIEYTTKNGGNDENTLDKLTEDRGHCGIGCTGGLRHLGDGAGTGCRNGGGLAYANHLAGKWRASQEFAKSKGWIKDYMVLSNYHNRAGEPDLYLITVMADIPNGPESEAQYEAYSAWADASDAQMEAENADRAEFREVMGTSLMQELDFKD